MNHVSCHVSTLFYLPYVGHQSVTEEDKDDTEIEPG